jgi:hypothetical protein
MIEEPEADRHGKFNPSPSLGSPEGGFAGRTEASGPVMTGDMVGYLEIWRLKAGVLVWINDQSISQEQRWDLRS